MTVKRIVATPERWTFFIKTNDGKHIVESKGGVNAGAGACLRILQTNIGRLSESEMDTLVALTNHITARMDAACKAAVRRGRK